MPFGTTPPYTTRILRITPQNAITRISFRRPSPGNRGVLFREDRILHASCQSEGRHYPWPRVQLCREEPVTSRAAMIPSLWLMECQGIIYDCREDMLRYAVLHACQNIGLIIKNVGGRGVYAQDLIGCSIVIQGRCPKLVIHNSENIAVYLSKESCNASIATDEATHLRIIVPDNLPQLRRPHSRELQKEGYLISGRLSAGQDHRGYWREVVMWSAASVLQSGVDEAIQLLSLVAETKPDPPCTSCCHHEYNGTSEETGAQDPSTCTVYKPGPKCLCNQQQRSVQGAAALVAQCAGAPVERS